MWYLKTHVAGVLAKLELRDRMRSTGARSTSSARAPDRRRPSWGSSCETGGPSACCGTGPFVSTSRVRRRPPSPTPRRAPPDPACSRRSTTDNATGAHPGVRPTPQKGGQPRRPSTATV